MNYFSIVVNRFLMRPLLIRRLASAGKNFRSGYSGEWRNPELFSVGDNFYCGPYYYFSTNCYSPVKIGSSVMLGPFVRIIGGNHDFSYTIGHISKSLYPSNEYREIVLEDGVWIGAGSCILSGAHISEGSVIGAHALVNHYIPPYSIAVGVPARRYYRRFNNTDELSRLLNNVNSHYTVQKITELYECYNVSIKSK